MWLPANVLIVIDMHHETVVQLWWRRRALCVGKVLTDRRQMASRDDQEAEALQLFRNIKLSDDVAK